LKLKAGAFKIVLFESVQRLLCASWRHNENYLRFLRRDQLMT